MIVLTAKHNFPDVLRRLDELPDQVAGQAAVRAVNRTMEQAKTEMSRTIRSEFNLPAGKVGEALKIRSANFRRGVFGVEATLESPSKKGRSLNLINFAARQTATGVSFKVKRGGARQSIKGAFIANGGRTVFIRLGKSRLPIKALQTIDVAQMFNARRVKGVVVRFMERKFPEIFEREARFYLDRFNRA